MPLELLGKIIVNDAPGRHHRRDGGCAGHLISVIRTMVLLLGLDHTAPRRRNLIGTDMMAGALSRQQRTR